MLKKNLQTFNRLLQKWMDIVYFVLSWWTGLEAVSANCNKDKAKRLKSREMKYLENAPQTVKFMSLETSEEVLSDTMKGKMIQQFTF